MRKLRRLGVLLAVASAACGPATNGDPDSPGPVASGIGSASDSQSPNGSDWPMYGANPRRTNHNAEEKRITVSNIGALAPLWQGNIGLGESPPSGTPTVAGARVFVGSSVPTGDNFFAFAAATGRPLWTADVGHSAANARGIGIGATAAVSGTLVIVGGGDRAYYGLRVATGEIVWRHEMDAGDSSFPWCSPLIANGRVYVGMASEFDNPSVRGEVRALELATGTLLARRFFVPEGLGGAGVWNSPTLSPDGLTVVVVTGEDFEGYDGPFNRAIVSLDATTLEIRQADKQGRRNRDMDWGSTPIIFHDRTGRVLVAANQKNGVFYTYVLDAIGTGPLWQRETGLSVGFMPAYDAGLGEGGTLFIGGSGGRIFAVDPATGADRWPPVTVAITHGNMALANGLLFLNANGRVFVLEEASGKILRVLEPSRPGRSFSGVAVAEGIVYWLSGGTLNAWRLL